MKKAVLVALLLSAAAADGQVASPCYFAPNNLVKCFPSSGLYLDNSRALLLGTDNTTNYVQLQAPTGMGSNYTLNLPSAQGASHTTLHDDGSGNLSWSLAALTTDVSGVLPIANGGTNGATATAGFDNLSPLTTTGDILYYSGTHNVRLGIGGANTVLHGGATPSYSAVADADITGVVSVTHGGTGSSSFTAGSIPYSNGTILTQDNANLFWDATSKSMGLGTTTPLHWESVTAANGHTLQIFDSTNTARMVINADNNVPELWLVNGSNQSNKRNFRLSVNGNAEMRLGQDSDAGVETQIMSWVNNGVNTGVGINTATPKTSLDVAGYSRVLGSAGAASFVPSAGKGAEITYDTTADIGYFYTYNRDTAAYKETHLNGATTKINSDTNGAISLDGSTTLTGGRYLQFNDTATHNIQLSAPATATTSYSLFFPLVQGGANQALSNDGSGNLEWLDFVTTAAFNSRLANNVAAKNSAYAASTANIASLSGDPGLVDGVDFSTGGYLLLKNQTTNTQNGLWVVTGTGGGAWTRDLSMPDNTISCQGAIVTVDQGGLVNANTAWLSTCDGSGAVTFVQIPTTTSNNVGALPVTKGGTGLASGTSGGIPYFSGTTTLTSSGALTSHAVVVGGGAGVAPTVVANNATATNKFLTQSSSGTPAWSTLVAGDLPSGPTVSGLWSFGGGYKSTAQPNATLSLQTGISGPNNSTVLVKFDTVDFDQTTSYSTGTGLYTVPTTGRYLISAYVNLESTVVNNNIVLWVKKNGSDFRALSNEFNPAGGITHRFGLSGSTILNLTAADTIGIDLMDDNVGATTIQAFQGTGYPYLSITMLN